MSVVKRLSDYVANQIAAGEVVSSPSSVVKELMENSIDAGAHLVIVNVKEGGSELIQIIDDGCGMSYEDALVCFERHATSKISDINDIYSLSTYGFRGEALASIAAVAEVEMLTRREGDELGTRVLIHAGDVLDHCPTACAVGTQIIIKNLFYNIPARRNFLKSKKVETKNIIDEFERVVLSYPKVTFCLYDNDQIVYNLPESNLRMRVSNVIGKQNNNVLMELYIENQVVEIRGYIGKPDSAKKNSPHFMFINGRYFYKSYFNKAIQLAYEKLLPPNKKTLPPYILYFSIDASRIDVNVSPSKTEVKFDDEQSVFQILELAIKESLGKNGIVPMIDFEAGTPIDVPIFEGGEIKIPKLDVNPYFNPFDETFSFSMAVENQDSSFRSSISDSEIKIEDKRTKSIENFTASKDEDLYDVDIEIEDETGSDQDVSEDSFKSLIITSDTPVIDLSNEDIDLEIESNLSSVVIEDNSIESYNDIDLTDDSQYNDIESNSGEIIIENERVAIKSIARFSDKYIVVTTSVSVLLINIFRASWRVLCDRLMNELTETNHLGCQKMLFPVEVELSSKHYYNATVTKEILNSLGFDYELFDKNRVSISGVPTDSRDADVELLFEDILDSVEDSENDYLKRKQENFIARISYVASSVKRTINDSECKYITEQLLLSPSARYTPNGKSIFISIEESEIEKMLK